MMARRKFLVSAMLFYFLIYLLNLFNNVKTHNNCKGIIEDTTRLFTTNKSSSLYHYQSCQVAITKFRRLRVYLGARIIINCYPNSMSTFQISRLAVSGDISPNPGPDKCNTCFRKIARNHRALYCTSCNGKYHMKCGKVKPNEYKRLLQSVDAIWSCPLCTNTDSNDCQDGLAISELPFWASSDDSLQSLYFAEQTLPEALTDDFDCDDSLTWFQSHIGSYYKFNLKIGYLNINSIINKMDEVKEMLNKNMFDILFIAETKIDKTTSSSLISQPGFRTVRKDCKKGAGGLLAYIRADISVYRRAKLEPADFETICLDIMSTEAGLLFVLAIDLLENVKKSIS